MAQKIPMDDEEFIKKYGEDAHLNTISIRTKKAFLKTREARRRMQKNPNINRRRGENDNKLDRAVQWGDAQSTREAKRKCVYGLYDFVMNITSNEYIIRIVNEYHI